MVKRARQVAAAIAVAVLVAGIIVVTIVGLSAQTQPAQKPQSKPAQPAATPAPQTAIPLDQALYLIRSSLLTLNDANHSGNYSVLRDLASPSLRGRNSAADLAAIFTDLRKRNFDLFAAALIAPQLSAPPQIDGNGMLRLTGVFPTRPLQIAFDFLFERIEGQWRLFGISVQTPQAPLQ